MSLDFKILKTSGDARRATMTLPHAAVETPVFMPVGTVGTVKAVPQHLLEEMDARIILGNTYHLFLRPGHELVRRMGGLHRFISWDRAMLTDSGGFQVFSLSDLRKVTEDGVEFRSHLDGSKHFFSPEHSMDVQIALGADICMAFDECTEYPADHERARQSLELTLRWAARSKAYFEAHKHERPWGGREQEGQEQPFATHHQGSGLRAQGSEVQEQGLEQPLATHHQGSGLRAQGSEVQEQPFAISHQGGQGLGLRAQGSDERGAGRDFTGLTPNLFGIVQGGMFKDLRRESAERLVEMDFPGYAIGGLSVGEPRELTREIIAETLPYLPKDKPRYVMGVGYPDEIVEYARMGVDTMDCVAPTRAARHGLLFTSQGRMNIRNRKFAEDQGPVDPECGCQTCRRYSRAYLRHLIVAGEALSAVLNSVHNLTFYLDTMRKVRAGIESATL